MKIYPFTLIIDQAKFMYSQFQSQFLKKVGMERSLTEGLLLGFADTSEK